MTHAPVAARTTGSRVSFREAVPFRQALDRVHDYYCSPRSTPGGQQRSIYQIWEAGAAFNDSVTPSTYCQEYRSHMVLKIMSLTALHDRIFSIGCGNAFVEAELLKEGRSVQCIDCNAEAVHLAASKGIEAFTADFFALPPAHLAGFSVVYADGLLGHLYQSDGELDAFFETLLSLRPLPGTWIVISNDAPLSPGAVVEPHARVSDFWLLSKACLDETFERFGFEIVESYYFPYVRPISGLRNRTICIARAASASSR